MDAGYLRRSGGSRGSVLDRARWPGHSRTLLPRVPSTARASVDRVHRNLERSARPRYCARIEVRDDGTGDRAWLQAGEDSQRRSERADSSHQPGDGLPGGHPRDRAASESARVTEEPYGVNALPELYRESAPTGMVAHIGTRIVEVAEGRLVLEGNMTGESPGVPTSPRTIIPARPAPPRAPTH